MTTTGLGFYAGTARYALTVIEVITARSRWYRLAPVRREAKPLYCTKVSRRNREIQQRVLC